MGGCCSNEAPPDQKKGKPTKPVKADWELVDFGITKAEVESSEHGKAYIETFNSTKEKLNITSARTAEQRNVELKLKELVAHYDEARNITSRIPPKEGEEPIVVLREKFQKLLDSILQESDDHSSNSGRGVA